jgi:hypothetical protein
MIRLNKPTSFGHWIFAVVLVLATTSLFAQQRNSISVNLSGSTFETLVKNIEQQSAFRFFYNHIQTDSIVVNVNASNETVEKVLEQAFAGTPLHFSVYQNNVYVAKDRQMMTSLPVDYFNEAQSATKAQDKQQFDYSDYERQEQLRKAVEDKLTYLGTKTNNLTGSATINGTVRDIKSGEAIIGAAVYIESPMIGVSTDQLGRFSLTIARGRHEIKIKSVGMKTTQRQVMLYSNGKLDIELEEEITALKEVVVNAERDVRVNSTDMGLERLDIRVMKQMPLVLGEADVMKVVLTLPGVQTVGEGTVGLNVRGGATNQNLILFNDAVVYNPSHMFGFFSTFNPDVLKNVELYKSGVTANYGGRLSSVLDVNARDGNLKKFSVSGGISPITGRITVEGPVIKDKASFIIGFRSTYSDWILKKVNNRMLNSSAASFYDITANYNHKINDKNVITLSGYMSKDKFKLASDTTYAYSDRNASLKWKHVFNPDLYTTVTATGSQYSYDISSVNNEKNAFNMDFLIRQFAAKADVNYQLGKHSLHAGLSATRYYLEPGNIQPSGESSIVRSDVLQAEQAIETALYVGDNYEVTPKLSLYAGLRYSMYNYLGERTVYQYADGVPRTKNTLTDSVTYGKGKSIANYRGPEPRFSARYIVTPGSSVKFSYNRMRQYIQMLSNTTAITPTDIWKLSDPYIKPQLGDQFSVGYYRNLKGNTLELSVETYYKFMNNTTDYKNGAVLLLNHHLETDILNARGKAYGIEFLIKKASGKLNGWISYTYSRSFLQTKTDYPGEAINRGEWYRSSYDKPHAFNFIGNYKVSRRVNFSLNVVYSTGRPITLPIAKYELDGVRRVFYSDRNQYRIPDYFRTDFSINVEGNHKIRKLAHSSWSFAVYNLTGRRNAYSVFFVAHEGLIRGYKLSVFGQPIPTITYNFKF